MPMPMSLTVLGTATPYPTPEHPCSGYLLRLGPSAILLDLGPGSLANLQRHHPLPEISAIWLSHLHADHIGDLPSLYYALAYTDLHPPGPIPVHAPAGLADRLAGFFGQPDTGFLQGHFEFHDLRDGYSFQVGDLHLTCRAVEHGVEAYALRAEYQSGVLAYSGDCGPCAGLSEVANGAHLLLCESGFDQLPAESPQLHHTPEDAGALAAAADAQTLLITHVSPLLDRDEAARRAGQVFPGRTVAALEGATYLLGRA